MEVLMNFRQSAGVAVSFCVFATGCSSSTYGDSGTAGHAITLKTNVDIKDELTKPVTNALGWKVTLSEAYLSVGALYYFVGDPVLSQRQLPKALNRGALVWLGDLLVPPAYAHPGHYIEGAAMGQMLKPTTIDILGDSVELADGDGITGLTNSARIAWQTPPKGDLADQLDGQVVLTRGTATKGDVTITFLAEAKVSEVLDGDGKAEVAGCAFGATPGDVGVDMDADGTVTLTLVPSVWFDQVDFSYVAPGAEDGPIADEKGVVDIAGTLAWAGFVRGIKKGTAYEFSYTK
jgi:hypothetical protein